MNYRINYIDGKDTRYKSFETTAINRKTALANLRNMYSDDYDHHIVEITTIDDLSEQRMRIGGAVLAAKPTKICISKLAVITAFDR